ncbi:MAG TPA: efflux transporter outer membrane subunit [Methylomirabilota bacterium]|nr:efflux transporter outer membrane subunit [Methylomirabilota bacterium]
MRRLVPLTLALVAAGCRVGPDHRPPAMALPGRFAGAEAGAAMNEPVVSLAEWWTVFNDARLTALVRSAAVSNLDVRVAAARVREARAQRGVARAALLPGIQVQGDYARARLSENSFNGQQAAAGGQPLENDLFDAGFDMSWELDVFGGSRRAVEAATARWQASIESGRDVLVTVLAETGLSYLDLRGAQRQLAVARENLRTQEQTLALTEDRFRAGLVSELDVMRAAAQVAATRAQIPPLEEAQQRALHRLGTLLGVGPRELESQLLTVAPIPVPPPRLPVGLPSDLLRQRPDIRRAERQLAAATADIGVATADLFPKFYLTGAAGLQSLEAADFFDGGSRFWSLGPTLRWPVFAGGRLRQNIRVRTSRQEEAALRYEQTVLTALEEVENALVAFGQEQERHRALEQSAAASRRAVALASERYRGGVADFLDVLEAERSLLAAEDNVAQSERRLGQNLVRLYKALGGGWQRSALFVAAGGSCSAP